MTRRHFWNAGAGRRGAEPAGRSPVQAETFEVTLTEAEWRAKLSPEAYAVLREEDTERPFTSPLEQEKRAGVFACAGCELPLFPSSTKFDSGTGWPSFWQPLPDAVGDARPTRACSARGPRCIAAAAAGIWAMCSTTARRRPGLRYCMNGVAMVFIPA